VAGPAGQARVHAIYEICEHEAVLVAEMFRRYTDEAASIADLARWLTEQNVPTRTGKHRWDRSVIWAMLRNPAYAGTAMFGKTLSVEQPAGINRAARLAGRSTPTAHKTIDRPREEWTAIAVPAIITEQTFARAEQRLADNKRFAGGAVGSTTGCLIWIPRNSSRALIITSWSKRWRPIPTNRGCCCM